MKIKKIASLILGVSLGFSVYAQMKPSQKITEALEVIEQNYVDSTEEELLADAAIRAMVKELDPHSQYLSRKEAEQMKETMSGSFAGIGIQYVIQNDSIYISQVFADSPAENAGLCMGDRIVAIDKENVVLARLSHYDVMKRIRGTRATKIVLCIERQRKTTPFTVELTRGLIVDKAIRAAYMVTDKIGYISLRIFNQTTRTEIDNALSDLKKQGMESLILDLQGNGGGYVEAAIGVADEFLQSGQLVFYSMPKDGGKDYYYTSGSGKFMSGKLAVLIDQATASSSEILSGALQDWDRAVLVGRRSFGKGVMQKPFPLPDGSVLELTAARYYTPSGRSIQKPYKAGKYLEDLQSRYTTGEMFTKEKIHFSDSLAAKTLVNKRTVYGGGGIMPDVYIPLDTSKYTEYVQEVVTMGVIGQVSFEFLKDHQQQLKTQYPEFGVFNKGFNVPVQLVNRTMATAELNRIHIKIPDLSKVKALLAIELKAQLASQLYSKNQYYLQVTNTYSDSFLQAVKILSDPKLYQNYLQKGSISVKERNKKHK